MNSNHHTGVYRKNRARSSKNSLRVSYRFVGRLICCNLLRYVAICNANKTCRFHRLALEWRFTAANCRGLSSEASQETINFQNDFRDLVSALFWHTACAQIAHSINVLRKGGEMRKFAIALAIVLGLNLVSSILSLSAPVSFAQEEPAPKPEKPES